MSKNKMKFSTLDSLQGVINVLNEAGEGLINKNRVIKDSDIAEVLVGALGAVVVRGTSFAALYGLGIAGLGMTGAIGVSGIAMLAGPSALLAGPVVGLISVSKRKRLKQEKDRLYQEALKKQNAIIKALKDQADADKERLDYLKGLNILLQQAVKDLRTDLGYAA